jgi:hypothetical protein
MLVPDVNSLEMRKEVSSLRLFYKGEGNRRKEIIGKRSRTVNELLLRRKKEKRGGRAYLSPSLLLGETKDACVLLLFKLNTL